MPESPPPTVVVVDDEEMVATSVRSFLELETSYRIVSFTDPLEALRQVESELVHVVVADFMMPGMDGITLLQRIRQVRPETTRILLTGYAEKEDAIRAINQVGLYYYLEKPWDNDRLKLVVRNGVERACLFNELDARVAALEAANEDVREMRLRLIRAFL